MSNNYNNVYKINKIVNLYDIIYCNIKKIENFNILDNGFKLFEDIEQLINVMYISNSEFIYVLKENNWITISNAFEKNYNIFKSIIEKLITSFNIILNARKNHTKIIKKKQDKIKIINEIKESNYELTKEKKEVKSLLNNEIDNNFEKIKKGNYKDIKKIKNISILKGVTDKIIDSMKEDNIHNISILNEYLNKIDFEFLGNSTENKVYKRLKDIANENNIKLNENKFINDNKSYDEQLYKNMMERVFNELKDYFKNTNKKIFNNTIETMLFLNKKDYSYKCIQTDLNVQDFDKYIKQIDELTSLNKELKIDLNEKENDIKVYKKDIKFINTELERKNNLINHYENLLRENIDVDFDKDNKKDYVLRDENKDLKGNMNFLSRKNTKLGEENKVLKCRLDKLKKELISLKNKYENKKRTSIDSNNKSGRNINTSKRNSIKYEKKDTLSKKRRNSIYRNNDTDKNFVSKTSIFKNKNSENIWKKKDKSWFELEDEINNSYKSKNQFSYSNTKINSNKNHHHHHIKKKFKNYLEKTINNEYNKIKEDEEKLKIFKKMDSVKKSLIGKKNIMKNNIIKEHSKDNSSCSSSSLLNINKKNTNSSNLIKIINTKSSNIINNINTNSSNSIKKNNTNKSNNIIKKVTISSKKNNNRKNAKKNIKKNVNSSKKPYFDDKTNTNFNNTNNNGLINKNTDNIIDSNINKKKINIDNVDNKITWQKSIDINNKPDNFDNINSQINNKSENVNNIINSQINNKSIAKNPSIYLSKKDKIKNILTKNIEKENSYNPNQKPNNFNNKLKNNSNFTNDLKIKNKANEKLKIDNCKIVKITKTKKTGYIKINNSKKFNLDLTKNNNIDTKTNFNQTTYKKSNKIDKSINKNSNLTQNNINFRINKDKNIIYNQSNSPHNLNYQINSNFKFQNIKLSKLETENTADINTEILNFFKTKNSNKSNIIKSNISTNNLRNSLNKNTFKQDIGSIKLKENFVNNLFKDLFKIDDIKKLNIPKNKKKIYADFIKNIINTKLIDYLIIATDNGKVKLDEPIYKNLEKIFFVNLESPFNNFISKFKFNKKEDTKNYLNLPKQTIDKII